MKSYTDIEQSKKLTEFLPLESADMEYMFLKEDGNKVSNIPFVKDNDEPEWPSDSAYDFIPCWSLATLLDVLPSATLDSSSDHYYRLHCMTKYTEWYDNPVDACVDAIKALHELNLL